MKNTKKTKIIILMIILVYTMVLCGNYILIMPYFHYEKVALLTYCLFMSVAFCICIDRYSAVTAGSFVVAVLYAALMATQVIFVHMPQYLVPICMPAMLISIIYKPYCGIVFHLLYCMSYSFILNKGDVKIFMVSIVLGVLGCLLTDFMNNMENIIKSFVAYYAVFAILEVLRLYYIKGFIDYFIILQRSAAIIITIAMCFACVIMLKLINIRKKPAKEKKYIEFIKDDFPPMKELRDNSLRIYYHTLEVADLSAAAAISINADAMLARAGAMYHDIGKAFSNNYVQAGVVIARENDVPKEILDIIEEHNGKLRIPQSKEAAIVLLADTIISTKEYMSKIGRKMEELKIIDNVMSLRLDSGLLDESGLNLMEYKEIKKTFSEILCGKGR